MLLAPHVLLWLCKKKLCTQAVSLTLSSLKLTVSHTHVTWQHLCLTLSPQVCSCVWQPLPHYLLLFLSSLLWTPVSSPCVSTPSVSVKSRSSLLWYVCCLLVFHWWRLRCKPQSFPMLRLFSLKCQIVFNHMCGAAQHEDGCFLTHSRAWFTSAQNRPGDVKTLSCQRQSCTFYSSIKG